MTATLREQFLLRRDITFLNHGSYGACPRTVFETYQAWQRDLESQPADFLGRRVRGLLAEARASLASYLGAGTDDLVFFPNVTHALNVAARSLPLRTGDEVLTTDHEYGALDRTWRYFCTKAGAEYVRVELPLPLDDPSRVVDAIWSRVTDRTRVLFLSHVTSATAVVLPIRPLIERSRARGIWSVIDGAHAPGQIDLDLDALGADFYGGNCHKWLCAPKGAGFLHVRRAVQHLAEPLVVSWGWQPVDPGPSPFVDTQERQGTMDPAAYLSVPAAIEFQRDNRWPAVRDACHERAARARREIERLTDDATPVCADDPLWYRQMTTVPLPACDIGLVKRRLYDEFAIEVPVLRWRDRPWIRVSIQAYNDDRDVDRLVAGLTHVLRQ